MGVTYESVRSFGTDTHTIPDCGMTVASRGTVMGAQSVRTTGEKLKKIMIQNMLELQSISLEEVEKAYKLKREALTTRTSLQTT